MDWGCNGSAVSCIELLSPASLSGSKRSLKPTVQCRSEARMLKPLKVIGVVFVAMLLVTGVAVAQDRYGGSYGGSVNAKEHGYQHGYRDGLRQGRNDQYRHEERDFNTGDYKRADAGYERYMGERDDFQQGYRDGYRAGYDDGYTNRPIRSDVYGLDDRYDPDRLPRRDEDYGPYSRWGYSDVALDTGYRDGLQAGRQDFGQRKEYYPEKHDAYEDGNHGYQKSYGDKKLYKEQYRKGFVRGYEDAFNRR